MGIQKCEYLLGFTNALYNISNYLSNKYRSRIIVKDLPKYVTEDRLREHFGKKGGITDIKLMRRRDGESRRFAFIGYKSDDFALDAVKYFDKTFIDTTRIAVESAKSFADVSVPRSWKERKRTIAMRDAERDQRIKEEEEHRKEMEKEKWRRKKQKFNDNEDEDEDEKLKEFLTTMNPNTVRKYGDDKDFNNDQEVNTSKEGEVADHQIHKEANKDVNRNETDIEMTTEKEEIELKKEEEKEEDGYKAAVDNTISDLEWLKLRRTRIKENEDEEAKEDNNSKPTIEDKVTEVTTEKAIEESPLPEAIDTPEEKAIKVISTNGRLFLRNISYDATEDDFKILFEKYGELTEVHVPIDTKTNKSKGFAYIQFKIFDDACKAYYELDKQIFQGRLLHILPAQKKRENKLDEEELKNLPLKKQNELKRKYEAAKQQFSWNSLYLNQEAVLEAAAAKMGIDKTDIINPDTTNGAVRQALAEASIINDVRTFFETHKVDLTKFSEKEKSDTVILVKNIPFGTTSGELGELFSEHGQLSRVIVPPSGTIAIIEFKNAPDARTAFARLAYRRFKTSIIYLEKGPKDLFTAEASLSDNVEKTTDGKIIEIEDSASVFPSAKEEEDAEEDLSGPTISLFIKNINFTTTTADLKNLFKPLEGFVTCQVKTKPNTKNPSKPLSMGFGFVEFRTKEQAKAALKAMDGFVLASHKLQIKISHREGSSTQESSSGRSKKRLQSKIIIKNLPFQATRKELVELLGAFGQLKNVRVPKKIDKTTRGFAFAEFMIPKEAETAMNSLKGTHLYGRKLIMEYAEHDASDVKEEIERMQKKVRSQQSRREIASIQNMSNRKRVELEGDEDM